MLRARRIFYDYIEIIWDIFIEILLTQKSVEVYTRERDFMSFENIWLGVCFDQAVQDLQIKNLAVKKKNK